MFLLHFGYLGLTGAAHAIDIEGIAILAETFQTSLVDGIGNLGGFDLCHLSTDRTDLMAMTHIVVTCFIDRRPLKTMADDQSKLEEQIQRIIEGRSTDGKIIILHQSFAQLIKCKMPFSLIDSFQNGITLRTNPSSENLLMAAIAAFLTPMLSPCRAASA